MRPTWQQAAPWFFLGALLGDQIFGGDDEGPCPHDPSTIVAGRCECGAVWDRATRRWIEPRG